MLHLQQNVLFVFLFVSIFLKRHTTIDNYSVFIMLA